MIKQRLVDKGKMVMPVVERRSFHLATEYHICGDALGVDKVCDQYHITDKYRGAAHKAYNLKLRLYPNKFKVPVVSIISDTTIFTSSFR